MQRHPFDQAVKAVAALAMLVGWLLLAPPQVGGGTRYLVTSGVSMLPDFHAGDLVLLRETDSYRVGDIAGYDSTTLGTLVLHRIVDAPGGRYVFKGDNNAWLDPEQVRPQQLRGRIWLHLPGGGRFIQSILRPLPLAAIIGALFALGGGASAAHRRRRGGRKESTVRLHAPPADRGMLLRTGIAIALTGTLASAIAFSTPATHQTTRSTAVNATTEFGYSATAPSGPVYPDGTVRAPDPVFLNLVSVLTVEATRTVPQAGDVHGTSTLTARLSADSGWHHDVTLAPPEPFTGNVVSRSGRLDLAALTALTREVEASTAAHGTYRLALVLDTTYTATFRGQRVSRHDRPSVAFTLGATELRSAQAGKAAANEGAGPRATDSITIYYRDRVPNTVGLGVLKAHVGVLRLIAPFGLLAGVLLALLAWLLPSRRPDDARQINRRYARVLVPVTALPKAVGQTVDVECMAALASLASGRGLPVLHHRGEADTYLVLDERTAYRYRLDPAAEPDGTGRRGHGTTGVRVPPSPGSGPSTRR